jgi:uncharacterized protein (DUF885 family)
MVKVDIGVNYYSWTLTQLNQYLSDYYNIGIDVVEQIFNQMIEVPVNTSQYYYSYYTFLNLRDYMESQLGTMQYQDFDFHKIVLDTGPAPFSIIKNEIDKFISEKDN